MIDQNEPSNRATRNLAHQSVHRGQIATISLLAGAFFVILTRLALLKPSPAQTALWALLVIGVVLFASGVSVLRGWSLPRNANGAWLKPFERWLNVTPTQLFLLALAPLFAGLTIITAGEKMSAQHAGVSLSAWIIMLGCLLLGSWRKQSHLSFDEQADAPSKWDVPIKWYEIIFLISLFVLAFGLRWWSLETLPSTLSGDEASAGLFAIDLKNGRVDNLFRVGWFSFPSLYFAIQSKSIALFGQTITALRAPSVIAGALTVVALYLLTRSLFGRLSGLLTAGLLATQHFHINFSRIGLNNIWDGLFAVLALLGLWHGWQHGRRWGWILCGASLGLGQYFYVSGRVMPLVVLVWVLGVGLIDRARWRTRFADSALAAYIAVLIYAPLAIYFLRNPAEFYAPLQRVTVFEGWLEEQAAIAGTSQLKIVFKQIWLTASGIFSTPLEHWYSVGQPLLLPVAASLFLLGVVAAVISWDKRHFLIALPIFAIILTGAFSRDAPASQRYIIIAPLALIWVVFPLRECARWLSTFWPRLWLVWATCAIIIIGGLMSADFDFYFNKVRHSYVLGGFNTETAMVLSDYLADQTPQTVYFLGWPRMNYSSVATVPYLSPHIEGRDLIDPLEAPFEPLLTETTTFVFLPERLTEFQFVEAQHPEGAYQKHVRMRDGKLLFITYQVRP